MIWQKSVDCYIYRVDCVDHFGIKGLSANFISGDKDNEILKDVQSRFEDIIRRIYATLNQPCMNKLIEKATNGQL